MVVLPFLARMRRVWLARGVAGAHYWARQIAQTGHRRLAAPIRSRRMKIQIIDANMRLTVRFRLKAMQWSADSKRCALSPRR